MAATMVGIERKNENSSAEARDMPASCPPAMVDMEREVPGKTAERIWQAPIQIACPRLMASIFQVWMRLAGAPGPAASDWRIHGVDDPHHDSADQQGPAHDRAGSPDACR